MLIDDRPELFERLTVLGEHLDAERAAADPANAVAVSHPPARRRLVPLVAAVVITVLGLATLTQLDRGSELAQQPASTTPSVDTAPDPAASTPTDATATDSTPEVVVPVDEIRWERAVEPGSVARSQVFGVVAGPAGFVAAGMGFDDGRNQGRVWHSADGLVWDEPAFDLFEPKTVGSVVATKDAFYVIAGTNPDRLGLGEEASSPDLQLFRSVDGRSWEPWGEPWGAAGAISSTNEVLLRSPELGVLQWSANGLDWTPATFTDGPIDDAYFDTWGGVVHGDDIAYLRGFTADEFAVWSTTDGVNWQQLPTPPGGGQIAAAADGIVMITNPREQECADLSNQLFDDLQAGVDDPVAPIEASWTCTSQLDVYRYTSATTTWSLDPHHLGDTPVVPSLARLNNTLVAPLIEPTKALTIWTAAADTLDWAEQTPTRLSFNDNAGSPSMAIIAASTDQVVVFTPDRLVDEQTAIIVGSLEPASG